MYTLLDLFWFDFFYSDVVFHYIYQASYNFIYVNSFVAVTFLAAAITQLYNFWDK